MKDPYAPAFWCTVVVLATLSAGYYYGIRSVQHMHLAVQYLYAAAAVTGSAALAALVWVAWRFVQINRRVVRQGHTLLTIWNTKVALRRVETVFDRYFWGSYWHSGRTFEEVMGELKGTPLEHSLDVLKQQCRALDREVHDPHQHWSANARDLSSVATAMARDRYRLDLSESASSQTGATAMLNRELEVLVYTWSARLRSFDHQLDELEQAYH
ncbi:hypothetical protein [Pseudomonas cremoricolorata]|uniref:NADH:ubiquinone oxidoreductase subunit N n=1 Tax=Pseudomonas cremoricolorata TaxID=157783 RepID=A0A089WR94_9PSED|nr:hypothetical protein [Pseudomonas cremoricolorata]AIR89022.1 NADH:ubiquinone oxidoreductase subunit N [Pseudomonas cremoricolorata]